MKRYLVAGDVQNQCFRSVSGHDAFQEGQTLQQIEL